MLGPILFFVFRNDIPDECIRSKCRLFADDRIIYRTVNTEDDAISLWPYIPRPHPLWCSILFKLSQCINCRASILRVISINEHILGIKLEALGERRPPWPRQIITPILSTVKMLSLAGERLTPKILDRLPAPRSGYATAIMEFSCLFTHLRISRLPRKCNQFFLVLPKTPS